MTLIFIIIILHPFLKTISFSLYFPESVAFAKFVHLKMKMTVTKWLYLNLEQTLFQRAHRIVQFLCFQHIAFVAALPIDEDDEYEDDDVPPHCRIESGVILFLYH